MERVLKLIVTGDEVQKNRSRAGVQGEANATDLVVVFDESWDGYAKKITWFDALGQNPVVRVLTADLLEDLASDTRTYRTTIPGEPLAEAGKCLLVIDGYIDGKRARSIPVRLTVDEAPTADNAGEPADPTPSQAEQLQVQIEALLPTIQADKAAAQEAAAQAEASAADAASHALQAQETADAIAAEVQADVDRAQLAADEAEAQKTLAAAQAILAQEEADKAADSAESAEAAAKVAEECAARADQIAGGDFVTPTDMAKAKQEAIEEAQESLNVHATNKSNPHGVTAAQVGAAPASHVGDTNNPHGVTASQVGALASAPERYACASMAELTAALNTEIADMVNYEHRHFTVSFSVAVAPFGGGTWMGDIHKTINNYAVVTLYGYSYGSSIIRILSASKYEGSWTDWAESYHEGNKPAAADVGALPIIEATSSSYDMDAIIKSGAHCAAYKVNSNTLGTPYKYNQSDFSYGLVVSVAGSANYGQQLAILHGAVCLFHRRLNSDGTISKWSKIYSELNKPTASDIQAGTLVAGVKAPIGTDYTTMRLRNIMAQTADVTAGTTGLSNGNIILVYE